MYVSASSLLISFAEAVTPLCLYSTQAIRVVKLKIECDMRPACAKSLLNLDAHSSLSALSCCLWRAAYEQL